jgi:hypothetical protein
MVSTSKPKAPAVWSKKKGMRAHGIVGRGLGAVVGAALAVTMSASPALAAGSPYSGPPALPSGGVPGGYRSVVTAVTVSRGGQIIRETFEGILGIIDVPLGSAPHGEQLIVTKGATGAINASDLKHVPANVARDHAIYALAVLFQRYQRPVENSKFVTIMLHGKQFRRGDYVVVYSPAAHGFVPAPKGTARAVNGEVVVRFRAGTELAVLAS